MILKSHDSFLNLVEPFPVLDLNCVLEYLVKLRHHVILSDF